MRQIDIGLLWCAVAVSFWLQIKALDEAGDPGRALLALVGFLASLLMAVTSIKRGGK